MRIIDADAFEKAFVNALLENGVLTANETRKYKLTPTPTNRVAIELRPTTGQTVIAAEVYMWQNGSRQKIERCLVVEDKQDVEE